MQKETFNVTGMTCSACSARVERAVKKMEGTAEVSVNLLTNTMTLAYDTAVTSPAALFTLAPKPASSSTAMIAAGLVSAVS